MELKTNTGVIFRNEKKTDDKHPDYKGSLNVENSAYDIACWVNTSKDGKKYFSVKLSETRIKDVPAEQKNPTTFEGDLPF